MYMSITIFKKHMQHLKYVSVQFSAQSCLTVCDPMDCTRPGLLCSSPTPRACSDSWTPSQWCHPTLSSSAVPFSSWLQFFPASESFLMSWLFKSVGQSIGASVSASVLPMNIQDWFPLELTDIWSYTRVDFL